MDLGDLLCRGDVNIPLPALAFSGTSGRSRRLLSQERKDAPGAYFLRNARTAPETLSTSS